VVFIPHMNILESMRVYFITHPHYTWRRSGGQVVYPPICMVYTSHPHRLAYTCLLGYVLQSVYSPRNAPYVETVQSRTMEVQSKQFYLWTKIAVMH